MAKSRLESIEMSVKVQERQGTLVRQSQIVDAAQRLIVRYGSEHVTVRRMAKEVGLSEGAIYRHFKSKRDVLSLLIDSIEENLIGDIEHGRSGGRGPLGMLKAVLRGHLSAISQRRGVSFQVIAEIVSLGDKRLNRKVSGVIMKYINRIKELLSEGVEAGELKQDLDLDAAAALFFGMIQGVVSIWTLSDYEFDLEQKALPLWNVFRSAIEDRQA